MRTQLHTPTEYKQAIARRLKNDLQTAQAYLKMCRHYILESDHDGDSETLYFWANQQDSTLQQIQSIGYQLKVYSNIH